MVNLLTKALRTISSAQNTACRQLLVFALLPLFASACTTPDTGESTAKSEQKNKNEITDVSVPDPSALPHTPLGGYLAGRHARKVYDSSAAAVFFNRALIADPDNSELLRHTLAAMVGERKIEESLPLANRLIASNVSDPTALLTVASEFVRTGAYEKAREHLSSLPRTGFYPYLKSLLTSWTLVGDNDGTTALEELELLQTASNFSATHDYHVGLITDLLGMTGLAQKTFRSAVTSVRGPRIRSVLAAGSFFERNGQTDNARKLYQAFPASAGPETTVLDAALSRIDAGEEAPPLVYNAKGGFAEALYEIGAAFFKDRAYAPALIYTQLALHVRPDFDVAQILLADLYVATGLYTEAVKTFRNVPKESPFLWSARIRLASALNELGELEAARKELRTLATEKKERSDSLMVLADLLRTKEQYHDAVSVYDEAIARIGTIEQRHWTVFYARGMSLERSGEWSKAESDFLRALELQPDQPLVLNYLGYSWVDMGMRLPEARSMIEKAVSQRPNDGYIVDSLGWVLYRLKDFDAALVHLERAVELRPNDPVITDHYGDALWQTGRRTEARFQWRRALSLNPNPDLLKSVEEKLRRGGPTNLQTSDQS